MELILLNFFLGVVFVLAPLMTRNFFLPRSTFYSKAHILALLAILLSVGFGWSIVSLTWLLFCAFGFLLYLRNERGRLLSAEVLAACIPFVFSLVSSLWFVAGSNDWHLLGYNKNWSFYAALHGAVLGWLFVGCVAFLAVRPQLRRVYLPACFLCPALFLCVAFGIDGVPYVKRLGLIGLSLLVPICIGAFVVRLKKTETLSLALSAFSLLSILLAMTLALLNEFWADFPKALLGIPSMTLTHGLLNALVTVPFFYFAIRFEKRGLTI